MDCNESISFKPFGDSNIRNSQLTNKFKNMSIEKQFKVAEVKPTTMTANLPQGNSQINNIFAFGGCSTAKMS